MKRKPVPRLFVFGDRVKLRAPSKYNPENFQHGVVVFHKGTYAKTLPRVRWFSGWGTSVPVARLVHLSADECAALPMPTLCKGDATPPTRWGAAKRAALVLSWQTLAILTLGACATVSTFGPCPAIPKNFVRNDTLWSANGTMGPIVPVYACGAVTVRALGDTTK